MKTIIRKTVVTASLVLGLVASTLQVNAENNALVYDSSINTSIGITAENAVGRSYTITDKKGNVILKGVIKSNKTFFIPTGKLGKGSFQFVIGSLVLQEFVIK